MRGSIPPGRRNNNLKSTQRVFGSRKREGCQGNVKRGKGKKQGKPCSNRSPPVLGIGTSALAPKERRVLGDGRALRLPILSAAWRPSAAWPKAHSFASPSLDGFALSRKKGVGNPSLTTRLAPGEEHEYWSRRVLLESRSRLVPEQVASRTLPPFVKPSYGPFGPALTVWAESGIAWAD